MSIVPIPRTVSLNKVHGYNINPFGISPTYTLFKELGVVRCIRKFCYKDSDRIPFAKIDLKNVPSKYKNKIKVEYLMYF